MKLSKYIGDKAFYKKVLAVTLPILLQNVITNFVNLLDNIMVGQVGTEPMSGVAIVNQLIFVFNLCIFGGTAGAGIFTAQFYGKKDNEGVRNTFRMKMYIAVVISAIFTVILTLFGTNLISAFLHEGEEGLNLDATLDYGLRYLKIMMLQLLPFAVSSVYSSTLRETGETLVPMRAGAVSVVVNMVFNYLFIFGKFGFPELGVEGAAIATVMARVVECAIVVYWTHRHSDRNEFIVGVFKSLKIPGKLVKQISIMGLPLLINELLWSSGMTMLNQCYSVRGLEVVPATNIASTVSNLFFCGFFAMGNSIAIIVGHLLGAGETEKAIDEDRKLIALSVILCVFLGAIMASLSPVLPEIYNTSDTVKGLASRMLLIVALMMPAESFTNACYFTIRSGGKTVITFIFDSAFVWTVCVTTAAFLAYKTSLPILTMYLIIHFLEFIKCAIGFVMVKKRIWVNNIVAEQ